MNRRAFNQNLGLVSMAIASGLVSCKTVQKKNPVFLIISGWQTVNIGDIAHTPGLLALIDSYFPNAEYWLWPRDIEDHGVEEMLKSNFPKLKVLKTNKPGDTDVKMSNDIRTVFDQSDMLIHGSGPHVLEINKINLWREHTTKPYGICGVTEQNIDTELRAVIENSSFFFTRETASLQIVEDNTSGLFSKGFFPDATFALKLKNEDKAQSFLDKNNLKNKEFICIVPRLRFSPYYKIHEYVNWSQEKIDEVNAVNDQYKEIDHAKLRKVIIEWVREMGKKVLVCPEMSYQIEIMDELLINPLPEDVKPFVIKKAAYWITDEAASVYKRAFAVVSMECHSPIIAFANNTPAFYIRQKEDTIKGQMYHDIGLSDWVFEIDETTGDEIYGKLQTIINDEDAAQQKIFQAYKIINQQYHQGFDVIRKTLDV